MARPESRQIGGYFPTPSDLLPAIASTITVPDHSSLTVFDPCAGDGEAVVQLAALWGASRTVACELEASRAEGLDAKDINLALHADALRLTWSSATDIDILYLNPPYDWDTEYQRLEDRFLVHLATLVSRALVFLVPRQALRSCAETLARGFRSVRVWRVPDPHYEVFRQVLVVAEPSTVGLLDAELRDRLLDIADGAEIPVLETSCSDPLKIPKRFHWDLNRFEPKAIPIRADAVFESFETWDPVPDLCARPLDHCRRLLTPSASPPHPAHLALALTEGLFNGLRLDPDDPERHPSILASGSIRTTSVPVETKTNDDGEVIGHIHVEQPRLDLTIYDLQTGCYHDLEPSSEPSLSDDPAEWVAADLLLSYRGAMVQGLRDAFPLLHDPLDSSHDLQLPTLKRPPYKNQHHTVAAALKVLASGSEPTILGEVGTGKTLMALLILNSLLPSRVDATRQQLQEQGMDDAQVPGVQTALVLCPPHLVDTWTEETELTLKDQVDVRVIESIADIESAARSKGPQLLILSREKAKLGYRTRGVESETCPRCGTKHGRLSATLARRRIKCEAETPVASSFEAQAVLRLLPILLAFESRPSLNGTTEIPCRKLPGLKMGDLDAMARAIVERFQDDLLPLLEQAQARFTLAAAAATSDHVDEVLSALRRKQGVEGQHQESIRKMLEELADAKSANLLYYFRNLLRHLISAAEWDARACGEPLYYPDVRPLGGSKSTGTAKRHARPRTIAVADYIHKRHPKLAQLLIVDEAHEYGHRSSAQSQAMQTLAQLPGTRTVFLTGTLTNGYASSAFLLRWLASPKFRQRFGYNDLRKFLDEYGYAKIFVPCEDDERGARSKTRKPSRIREAAGVHPSFILRWLLPDSIIIHKRDLDLDLPSIDRAQVPVGFDTDEDEELQQHYEILKRRLLSAMSGSRERKLKLLGALAHLPSYLDLTSEDCDPYEIRLEGRVIATGGQTPADQLAPKERFLLDQLQQHRENGRSTLVFLESTGTHLPERLLSKIKLHVTRRCAILDAKKVSPAERNRWIKDQVRRGIEVVLVNPRTVATGLNSLVHFSVGIFYQIPTSPTVLRQAVGRLHRPGQSRDVKIYASYYEGTLQEKLFDLVASKLEAAHQVDAHSVGEALRTAGADSQDAATSVSIGEALYESLTGDTKPVVSTQFGTLDVPVPTTIPELQRPVQRQPTRRLDPSRFDRIEIIPVSVGSQPKPSVGGLL
ncbi:MAG: DUF6094 domain-containing protein [Thermoanaerobaculia bacterium]|nr:DUF6094 domain-containing protein [Thermoanaerobaculia bacterium]